MMMLNVSVLLKLVMLVLVLVRVRVLLVLVLVQRRRRMKKCPLFWQLKTAADIACCREILPAGEPGRQGAYHRARTMLMLILFVDLRIFHFGEWLVLAWVHIILALSTFCHESTINLFRTVDRSDTAMPLSLKNLQRRLLLSVIQRRSRRLAKLRGINHSRSG